MLTVKTLHADGDYFPEPEGEIVTVLRADRKKLRLLLRLCGVEKSDGSRCTRHPTTCQYHAE